MHFSGSKLALFRKSTLLVYLRDDKPSIPFPARWDLPGGGRESDETPESCVLRELYEEFGLVLPVERLVEKFTYSSRVTRLPCYFFSAMLQLEESERVCFGDEGQCWLEMPVKEYTEHPQGIPELQLAVKRTRYFQSLRLAEK